MDFREYVIGEFDTEEQKKFRKEVGEWLDKNVTPELINGTNEVRVTAYIPGAQAFAKKLGEKDGWFPNGPKNTAEPDFRRGLEASLPKRYPPGCYLGPVFSAV